MLKSLIVMDPVFVDTVYSEDVIKEVSELSNLVHTPLSKYDLEDNLELLKDIDVIFSGWGAPVIDQKFLDHAPNLKFVFYAAGTIKSVVTAEFWSHGVRITTANSVNAIPVAEFTLACTIMGLKNTVRMNTQITNTKEYPKPGTRNVQGGFKAKIGLISLGAIARLTLDFFKMFDYEVFVYDPFVSEANAKALNVTLVSLDEIFEICDVVSLHTPLLDSTKNMIKKSHFLLMKENSTFINTARGAVVDEPEMIEALLERPDITAYLDVVYPEPPHKDSKLFNMDNVYLTPHIAGSEGREVSRMGELMLQEFKAYLDDEPLQHEVTKEAFEVMA